MRFSSASLRDVSKGLKRHGKVLLTQGGALEHTPKAKALATRLVTASLPLDTQWALAAQAAVKIGVKRAGWYRVSQSELAAAGLSGNVDPRTLRLFAEGVEHAIVVTGEADGHFDAGDAVRALVAVDGDLHQVEADRDQARDQLAGHQRAVGDDLEFEGDADFRQFPKD